MSTREQVYQLNSIEDDQKTISTIVEHISKHTAIKQLKDSEWSSIKKQLQLYDIFKEYHSTALFDVYTIEHTYPFKLLIVTTTSILERVTHKTVIIREDVPDHGFVGFVQLKKDYAHTYIRPETISDKLNELLHRVEIDFEINKNFSRKYYVLSSDEEALKSQISPKLLDIIASYDNLEIEIVNRILIVRTRNRISQKSADTIIQVLKEICDGKN
jgi:uncharacterized protein YlbG (UPF0298 family)